MEGSNESEEGAEGDLSSDEDSKNEGNHVTTSEVLISFVHTLLVEETATGGRPSRTGEGNVKMMDSK